MSKKMPYEEWSEAAEITKEKLASAAFKALYGGDTSDRDEILMDTYMHSRDLLCKVAKMKAGKYDDMLYLAASSYCRSYKTATEHLGDKIPKLSKEGLIDKMVEKLDREDGALTDDDLDKMFRETIERLDKERAELLDKQIKELDPELSVNDIIPITGDGREQRFVFRNDKGQLLFHARHVGIQFYFPVDRRDDDHLYMYFDVYVGKAGKKMTTEEIRQKLHEFVVSHEEERNQESQALKDLAIRIKKVDEPLYDVNLNTYVYNADGSVSTE